jgi:hypothetical protein
LNDTEDVKSQVFESDRSHGVEAGLKAHAEIFTEHEISFWIGDSKTTSRGLFYQRCVERTVERSAPEYDYQ